MEQRKQWWGVVDTPNTVFGLSAVCGSELIWGGMYRQGRWKDHATSLLPSCPQALFCGRSVRFPVLGSGSPGLPALRLPG